MAIGDEYVFLGFLTPVIPQLSFQSHRLPFSRPPAQVAGENTPERKTEQSRKGVITMAGVYTDPDFLFVLNNITVVCIALTYCTWNEQL